jgi:uncharacterized repeat protein (TIGR01451 family)
LKKPRLKRFAKVLLLTAVVSLISTLFFRSVSHNLIHNEPPPDKGNLSVALGSDSALAYPEQLVTYTVLIQNTGTVILNEIRVSQNLPTQYLKYLAGTTVAHKNGADLKIVDDWLSQSVNLGSLDVNQEETLTFEARVLSNVPSGQQISNIVYVRSSEIDWIGAANVVSAIVNDPITVLRSTNMFLVRNNTMGGDFASGTRVDQGDVLDFQLTLSNDGRLPARHVQFLLNLPSGTQTLEPTVQISSQDSNQVVSGVTIAATSPVGLVFRSGLTNLYGTTSTIACPKGCPIPEWFWFVPQELGTIGPGEKNVIQVAFSADIVGLAQQQPSVVNTPEPTPLPMTAPRTQNNFVAGVAVVADLMSIVSGFTGIVSVFIGIIMMILGIAAYIKEFGPPWKKKV